jgi:serine phosphatase RsbU (regulator of sigma subunit)
VNRPVRMGRRSEARGGGGGDARPSLPAVTSAEVDKTAGRLVAVARTGLTATPDPDMDRVASLVARLLRVPVALVSLVDAERQFFPGATGLDEPVASLRQTPLDYSLCRDVVAQGSVLRLDDLASNAHYRPHLAHQDLGVGAYLGVPLIDDGGHVLGSLCAIATEARTWSDDDVATMEDLAHSVSAELRARIATSVAVEARADATRANDRLRLSLAASDSLNGTLEPLESLARLLDVVVPALARWAVVYLPQSAEGNSWQVGRHADRHLEAEIDAFSSFSRQGDYRPPTVAQVLSGARPFASLPPAIQADMPAEVEERLRRIGIGPGLFVPLRARQEVIGALLLVAAPDADAFSSDDVQLALALGRRAGMAILHAQQYSREHHIAVTLQRSLLPPLGTFAGVEAAATYVPGAVGVEVGGDWYDLDQTIEGSLYLTIGDVTGHNIEAAAAMGRLRSALHVLIGQGVDPQVALTLLDEQAPVLLGDLLATCMLALLTPASESQAPTLQWSTAGHPPIAILEPTGAVRLLDVPPDPLLGTGMTVERHLHSEALMPGSIVVLYTDGLIEHRFAPLQEGLDDLLSALHNHDPAQPLEKLCADLVARLADTDDDTAILAVRVPTTP